MAKKMSLTAASGRLFRRHTDADALDDAKSSSRSRRKRLLRRGRTASSATRPPSRVSTSAKSAVTDESASTAMSSVEESVGSDDHILSATVIDIKEDVEEAGEQDDDAASGDEEDCNVCEDDALSKLLDWMPCLPTYQPQTVQPEAPLSDLESNIMKIECILRELLPSSIDQEEDASPSNGSRHYLGSRDVTLPHPSEWILDPLLLVATPGSSGMQIRRVRRVSDPSYFESPQCPGYEELDNSKVMQLPINNGREGPLSSWVIDFETDMFAGTALFRIRESEGWASKQSSTPTPEDSDYFANQSRKFQMVVRGRFKRKVVMVDCVTGLLLDRRLHTNRAAMCVDLEGLPFSSEPESTRSMAMSPKEKRKRLRGFARRSSSQYSDDSLPPKWALRAAVKVAAMFSPRMDANLECRHPRILGPLCSTAQTAHASRPNGSRGASVSLDGKHVEPSSLDIASLVNDLQVSSSSSRKLDTTSTTPAQQRKRVFDEAYDARVDSPAETARCFDTDAEYTFEFLQHLVNYNDLSLDLGKVLGKVRLGGALRGQAVRFISAVPKQRIDKATSGPHHMSMKDLDCLWSFDLWHNSLLR